ncbi:uridine kinase [Clostridium saccharobutylicum]|uniref:Uridine kinase n=2 Tax=Clostridium saccharobutylicum TaxID=169679 RepID=U5MTB7_CLOSA|nr:uridine kinase [Clostridium saccharobutylicum]AGX44014.1 uridine kinase [Clostridium saccharobutylicum DSM 13864]AQR91306.1 cytidylate kinase [Clostridium saccharobutylicum]AQS01210.1 cytidylate kinase [Clostridium saccharobutylicum]AQS15193.1 cytidylate kinase [Clostridium saccharobutylicum]MBA9009478.1 uridine kinase [Clostridium saccharobutylicum]
MIEEKLVMKESCRKLFQPVVEKINELLKTKKTPIMIAIDGMCASGKTTLGYYLQNKFDCNIFHMDDFFLQNEQRTEERLAEIGGNVDYERFKKEVIIPILNKKSIIYRPFRCDIRAIEAGKEIGSKRLNIIEGSYSQHPYFGENYQMKIFIRLPKEKQIERIRVRNGNELLEKFISEWIPKENAYFKRYHIEKNSVIISS